MRWLLLFCLFAISTEAAQDDARYDPKKLLLDVRQKVMATVNRLPKYMCTETIDRSTFQPEAKVTNHSCDDLAARRKKANWKIRRDASDRLRLDVAVSGGSEMFSWVGENSFEDRSLADLVRSGATSTGAFATFIGGIFGTNAASFTYNGDVSADGRAFVEFGFRVPLEKSGYNIGNKLYHANVPYYGTFLVDPETLDLVRLIIHADQLPPEIDACEDTTTLDYGIVRLNNADFLLPKNSVLRVVNNDGSEFENRSVFSSCHEFLGESTLRFDAAPDDRQAAAEKRNLAPLTLPAGLQFTLALTSAIETATAAAGDLITAKLTSPIKEGHNKILVPKGAVVSGRIVQIERLYEKASQSLLLAVRPETIEIGGIPQPFAARLDSIVEAPVTRRFARPSGLLRRQDLGRFDQMADPQDAAGGLLRFENVTGHYVIQRGLELQGSTVAAK